MTNIMSRYFTPPMVDATPSTSMTFSPELTTTSGDGDWISICNPFGAVAPAPDAAKYARIEARMAVLLRMTLPADDCTR